jgi:RimJ/RimL family protein N-acetyltransferase
MATPRIELVDATYELIEAAIADPSRLGQLLDAAVAEGWSRFPEALPVLLRSYVERPAPRPWGTLLFVLREPGTLIGLGGFKGAPAPAGSVEIGYEIAPAFRRQGLASEAACLMIARAFADPSVGAVEARTRAQVDASSRLLAKLGFHRVEELIDPTDGTIWRWRLDRPR